MWNWSDTDAIRGATPVISCLIWNLIPTSITLSLYNKAVNGDIIQLVTKGKKTQSMLLGLFGLPKEQEDNTNKQKPVSAEQEEVPVHEKEHSQPPTNKKPFGPRYQTRGVPSLSRFIVCLYQDKAMSQWPEMKLHLHKLIQVA
jgi:hypothetical protein